MEETSEQKPRRHLPNIPTGRNDHFESEEPQELHLYDDSSIMDTYSPLPAVQPGTRSKRDTGNKPSTSTLSVPQTKTHCSRGVKVKPAIFDEIGS